MRTAILSAIAVFALVSCASAQSVPDFSKDGWKSTGIRETSVGGQSNGKNGVVTVVINATATEYENPSKKLEASVLSFKGQEVSMFWGVPDGAFQYAIKVNGKWYASKEGAQMKGWVVLGGEATIGLKLTLDTTDGTKEVFLNLN